MLSQHTVLRAQLDTVRIDPKAAVVALVVILTMKH